jgi:sensor histidine kinase YesM
MKKTLYDERWLFIGIFWLVLGLSLWGQVIRDFPLLIATFATVTIVVVCFFPANILSEILLPKALAEGRMKLFTFQSIVMTIVMATFLSVIPIWFYYNFIHGTSFDTIEKMNNYGNWWARLWGDIPSAILINATACGFRFYQEHHQMEKNHALLQQAHAEAQLRILQDQINPHLMFNVMNHIHILMQKDVDLASVLLVRFSDILRYQLYECNREFVLLEREVKYLKDMVEIEKIRWGNELQVDCLWNISNGKREVVPLLLVPFVENAFKHVSRMPKQKGYVTLALKQQDDQLIFSIENSNSAQLPRKDNSHGLGLENVQKRLEILYPGRHLLDIEKTNTTFKVNLALQLGPQSK